MRVAEHRLGGQHFQHLFGVIFPVGGAVNIATGFQTAGQQLNKGRLHQTTLVMAFLGPGIREVDMNASQRGRGDHVAHHFHRVMLNDADIADLVVINTLEQSANTGVEHFHTQEVVVGTSLGNLLGGFTHAKTDFQNQGVVIAKHCFWFKDAVAVAD